MDLPTPQERQQILTIHLDRHGRDPSSIDLATLAQQAEHFSGAELEAAVVDGLYRAFRASRDLITEDISVALKSTVPLYRTYEDEIKALREWASTRARKASTDARLSELWSGP